MQNPNRNSKISALEGKAAILLAFLPIISLISISLGHTA
jgi:hypothetical protein